MATPNHIVLASDYLLAVATGGWRASARFKLAKAGLPTAQLPMASADDSQTREQIASIAMGRATFRYRRSFTRTILVGDSDCDVATAGRLGLSFVGIAADGQEALLRAAGAETILPDYRDRGKLMLALQASEPPRVVV
jgi:phosphoglycolate phosphatase-like HAD superfamily hydrolase